MVIKKKVLHDYDTKVLRVDIELKRVLAGTVFMAMFTVMSLVVALFQFNIHVTIISTFSFGTCLGALIVFLVLLTEGEEIPKEKES